MNDGSRFLSGQSKPTGGTAQCPIISKRSGVFLAFNEALQAGTAGKKLTIHDYATDAAVNAAGEYFEIVNAGS